MSWSTTGLGWMLRRVRGRGAVVDRGMASMGSSYGKVDAVMARWMWTRVAIA